jgi:hypothetical protein
MGVLMQRAHVETPQQISVPAEEALDQENTFFVTVEDVTADEGNTYHGDESSRGERQFVRHVLRVEFR